MAELTQEPRKWVGYPSPKEGPDVPFVRTDDKNPAFRGWLLVVVGWLYVILNPYEISTSLTTSQVFPKLVSFKVLYGTMQK